MRTTLDLTDELYRQVRRRAAELGISAENVVEQALSEYFRQKPRQDYRLSWHAETGALRPGIDLDSRSSLFDALDHS